MNYNDFTYYRANPYARQGYMPPIAMTNRHSPQFMTEIPMGQQHLQKIGKRQYPHGFQKSNIEAQSILKSPQRYPFENRIALDKKYERNMNTIDIEGATGGTYMSLAVRNKLKARQSLVRRQKQYGTHSSQHLQLLQATQQQKRRQLAYQQYLRNQHLQKINSSKLNIDQIKQINHQTNQKYNDKNRQKIYQRFRPQQTQQLIQPRYRSIEVRKESTNPESLEQQTISNKMKVSNEFNSKLNNSQMLSNYHSVQGHKNQQDWKGGLHADFKQQGLLSSNSFQLQSPISRVGRNLINL